MPSRRTFAIRLGDFVLGVPVSDKSSRSVPVATDLALRLNGLQVLYAHAVYAGCAVVSSDQFKPTPKKRLKRFSKILVPKQLAHVRLFTLVARAFINLHG